MHWGSLNTFKARERDDVSKKHFQIVIVRDRLSRFYWWSNFFEKQHKTGCNVDFLGGKQGRRIYHKTTFQKILFLFFFLIIILLLVGRGWGDAEFVSSTGARRDKKKGEILYEKKSFLSFSPPFVCALIVKPFPFLDSLHYLWSSLKRTHTHTHTVAALLTPTLSPECGAKRWSSLTLAFPHKLKLDEREAAVVEEERGGKMAAAALKWREVSH